MSSSTVFGILGGLVWGALCGGVNVWIMKRAIQKEDDKAILTANSLRMAVDLISLGLVFFARKILPFPYEPTLIGTAVALSVVTIVFAYRYGRPKKEPAPKDEKAEDP